MDTLPGEIVEKILAAHLEGEGIAGVRAPSLVCHQWRDFMRDVVLRSLDPAERARLVYACRDLQGCLEYCAPTMAERQEVVTELLLLYASMHRYQIPDERLKALRPLATNLQYYVLEIWGGMYERIDCPYGCMWDEISCGGPGPVPQRRSIDDLHRECDLELLFLMALLRGCYETVKAMWMSVVPLGAPSGGSRPFAPQEADRLVDRVVDLTMRYDNHYGLWFLVHYDLVPATTLLRRAEQAGAIKNQRTLAESIGLS